MPHVSQRAVAAACGVDQKTVSRVFLDPQTVAPATRDLVLATARQIGYAPVDAGRTLATGTVVVLLDDPSKWRSPLHPQALHALSERLTGAGIALVHACFPDHAFHDARALLKLARRFHCDALVCNYHGVVPSGLDEHLRRIDLPAVWLNRPRDQDAVLPDDLAAGHLATTHLLALGHRHITYLQYHWPGRQAEDEHFSVVERRAGYRLAMREAGLEPRVVDLDPEAKDPGALERQSKMLLSGSQAPTALLGYCNLAPSMLPWFAAMGVRVPTDLSLVSIGSDPQGTGGVDDTRSESDWSAVGTTAAELVLRRLREPKRAEPPLRVPPLWHAGRTSGAPPA